MISATQIALTAALILTTAHTAIAADSIPRLPAGPHMGFIEGFDDLRPGVDGIDRMSRANELRDSAIAAGMTLGRAQIDWPNLEVAPGVYDARELAESIEWAKRGDVAVFVSFATIDISSLALPGDLQGDDGLPRDGLKLDGPEIMGRLTSFLDWFIPELAKHNVWGLSIGNEMEGVVNDHIVPEAEVLNHLRGMAQHINGLDEDLAVTVTFTADGPNTLPNFVRELNAEMDIVTFNNYCLRNEMTATGPKTWGRLLEQWKEVAGNKEIFIQELGCPAGFGQDEPGEYTDRKNKTRTDIDLQTEFFAFHMDAFANDPQLRAATIFQLYDWSPDLSAMFTDPFRDAGIPLIGDRLEEWLATVGMCRWADTECRPAWDAWLAGLQDLKSERAKISK